MKNEEECCQKCGGKLDKVLGLCIVECLRKSNSQHQQEKEYTNLWNDVHELICNVLESDYVRKDIHILRELQDNYTITRK